MRSKKKVQLKTPHPRTTRRIIPLFALLLLLAGFSFGLRSFLMNFSGFAINRLDVVDEEGRVKVLNKNWVVPGAAIGQGVWVTLTLAPQGAYLEVFDAAPDASRRRRLARYPFPIKEPILSRPGASAKVSRPIIPGLAWLGRFLQAPIAALFGTMS